MTYTSAESSTATEGADGLSREKDKCDDTESRRYLPWSWFCVGLLLAIGSCLLTTTLLLSFQPKLKNTSTTSVQKVWSACITKDCNFLAQWIRVYVDKHTDPCEDFYKFVCNTFEIPNSAVLANLEMDIFKSTISAAYATSVPAAGQSPWQKTAALLKTCMRSLSSYPGEEIRAWFTSLNLDLRNLAPSDPFDPVDMLVRCSFEFGIPVIYKFELNSVMLSNNKRWINLYIDRQLISWITYQHMTDYMKIISYYIGNLRLYGIDSNSVTELAVKIVTYESNFFPIVLSIRFIEGGVDPVVGTILSMGSATTPVITPEKWAGSIAKYTDNTYQGSDTIEYIRSLPLLLAKALESKEVGTHGMRVLIAWGLLRNLLEQGYRSDYRGNERFQEMYCYKSISDVMGMAIIWQFINSEHSVITKKTVMMAHEVILNIYKAFKATLQSSWMKGSTREMALRKLDNMRHRFSGLAEIVDAAYVQEYYASFPDIHTDSFLKAWLEAFSASIRRAWSDTRVVPYKEFFVKAYNILPYNLVVVQAPILFPNLFFTEGPPAVNYGGFGGVFGHEMMHGFDVNGREYDENGTLRRWLSAASTKKYDKNVLCLQNAHKTVNPARQEVVNDTLDSENIADFVGTVVAHSAFSSLEPSKRDTIVQGVGMTANQLFFISYCAKFCELDYYPGDHYAPGRSRCIVPLMNMNEFSDAFHCKKGSHMNPPKKCTFWT